jgi:hypothetical protein
LATLSTQDTGQRQTKQKQQQDIESLEYICNARLFVNIIRDFIYMIK